ncbi:PH domain-containing protein [Phytohabitans houttuyneae]|uniref:DUF304 domain-containing protein n=1 Tax=Phytohabitans houttuyneae TaxID=1076126 RepID=A0A6V8KCX7_9ACTN|nr:PH domain-containing protein [Phytohabitans houttuyneae]GFJ83083.1 hypothetical protein Phou_072630 [Phytohabitans houttuyneae]
MSVLYAAVGGALLIVVGTALGDLLSEEVRGRLDRLPRWLLKLAGRRLPAQLRREHLEAWEGELHHIIRGAEALPITRLWRGIRFSAGLLRSAPAIAGAFGAGGVRPRRLAFLVDVLALLRESGHGDPRFDVEACLLPGEVIRGEWRRHWVDLVGRSLWGPVAAVGSAGLLVGVLSGGGWLVFAGGAVVTVAAGALLFGWRLLSWYCNRFVVTDQRLIVVSGIRAPVLGAAPLSLAAELRCLQTPAGRILNYGRLTFRSGVVDRTVRDIKNLPQPAALYRVITEQLLDPGAIEARLEAGEIVHRPWLALATGVGAGSPGHPANQRGHRLRR